MIRIGITGGIGSGKSLVCRVFEVLGIPVYYADDEAHVLTDSDPEIRNQLVELFGEEVYTGNRLNRPFMAQIIFRNKPVLEKVNGIIHPRVAEHFKAWCYKHAHEPYILHESAIIFETDTYKNFDRIIAVMAPENIRLKRVMVRRYMSPEKFRSVTENQLNEDELRKRADHLIINDENVLLLPQIIKLHHLFLSIQSNEKNQ